MRVKKARLVLLAFMLFLLCGCQNDETIVEIPEVTGTFDFSVLKAGQADAIILNTENHSVVIDCGEEDDGDEVVKYLSDKGIDKIDYLFITHFDKDHIGGVPEVINNFKIGQIITPDYKGANDEYENYKKEVEQRALKTLSLTENMSFVLDDVLFEVYPPLKKSYAEGDNDFSLAVSVTHGENSFLFTGDAEETRLAEIINQTNKEYDFLKVPHHGKYNKTTQKFIKSIKPVYSVITCSDKNPAEEQTVNVLESAGSKVYYTKDGNVNVSSNGTEITVMQ